MQHQDELSAIEKHVASSLKREFEHSLLEAIYEASPDGILVVDSSNLVISHNRKLFEVFGIPPSTVLEEGEEDLSGRFDQPFFSKVVSLVKDRDSFLKQVKELYADPRLEDLSEIELKNGRTLARHSKTLWSTSHHYLGRVWFFRNITERKNLELSLREMSCLDPLTNVANRRHFFERASEEISRARRFGKHVSFVLLDIDEFKEINDKWGHAIGDKVLKHLCGCAETMLRQEDLFGRYGGEEFVILLPDTDLQGAFDLAERLRSHIASQAITTEGLLTLNYTFSAGVATFEIEEASAESTLARADEALFSAKKAGRNCVRLHRIGSDIDSYR